MTVSAVSLEAVPITEKCCAIDVTVAIRECHRQPDGIRRMAIETARMLFAAGGRAVWIDYSSSSLYEIDRKFFNELFPEKDRQVLSPWYSAYLPAALKGLWSGLKRDIDRKRRFRRARRTPFVPTKPCVLMLFGIFSDQEQIDALRELKKNPDLILVPYVHDIIPIRRPELCVPHAWDVERHFGLFREGLKLLASAGPCVIANSTFTKNDFLKFLEESNQPPCVVSVATLASDLDIRAKPESSPRLEFTGLAPRRFALMVGTFDPRKNHYFAYQIWRRLSAMMGEQAIPLVFAGQRGWMTDEVMQRIKNDPDVRRRLLIFEGATDSELAWLYSNAAFTIFPSDFEGWGLPITESLSFGTPCLAANNTSLREASQGLAWHADTLDGSPWLAEIERCILDPIYLEKRRAAITAQFVKRRWADFLADVLAQVSRAVAGRIELNRR